MSAFDPKFEELLRRLVREEIAASRETAETNLLRASRPHGVRGYDRVRPTVAIDPELAARPATRSDVHFADISLATALTWALVAIRRTGVELPAKAYEALNNAVRNIDALTTRPLAELQAQARAEHAGAIARYEMLRALGEAPAERPQERQPSFPSGDTWLVEARAALAAAAKTAPRAAPAGDQAPAPPPAAVEPQSLDERIRQVVEAMAPELIYFREPSRPPVAAATPDALAGAAPRRASSGKAVRRPAPSSTAKVGPADA